MLILKKSTGTNHPENMVYYEKSKSMNNRKGSIKIPRSKVKKIS